MRTARTIASLRAVTAAWRQGGERIALVPTMGNLHHGHLSLVELAKQHADRVIVSVFVNPTQFSPGEDYATYPRTLDNDRRRLGRVGAELLFTPTVEEIYPGGTESTTVVAVPGLSTILCGEFRPGHFDGVTSVVARLLGIALPDVAVFGQKDYQQLVIIRRMVADLHLPVEIIAGPTCRDADGVALSSRNQYLSAEDRARAPAIHAALQACAARLRQLPLDIDAAEAAGRAVLEAADMQPDYFTVRRGGDLGVPKADTSQLVVLTAVRLGRARLIDNVLVSA